MRIMSNFLEYDDKVIFHPGYYIKEIVEQIGLTQEDFAKRLGTTPKNLSVLISGEQNLSIDIALRLSRMLGTTVGYWLNLQLAYDEALAKIRNDEELQRERYIFKQLDCRYFKEHFSLPDSLPEDETIKWVREFLSISSLTVLERNNLTGQFRALDKMTVSDIVNANATVQIAINQTLKMDLPKYDKKKFRKTANGKMSHLNHNVNGLSSIQKDFSKAGVALVMIPNVKRSVVLSASKKVNKKLMIMINGQWDNYESIYQALVHEIEYVLDGNLGISFNY